MQDMSCGQISDQQEVPSQEKSNPREAAVNVNIRINQEMAVKPAMCAEIKISSGPAHKGNDVADVVLTPTNDNPGSEGSVEAGTSNDDKMM